jgi:TolB protein
MAVQRLEALAIWCCAAALALLLAPAAAGDRILFASNRPSAEIHVMDADGRAKTRITHRDPAGSTPAWSPDGSRIAFNGSSGSSVQLWVMDRDGENLRPLGFQTLEFDVGAFPDPDWSPGGGRIVLSYKENIYVVNRDGTERRRLTRGSAEDWDPSWSPAGRWIAFTRAPEIWRMRTNGTGKQALGTGDDPDWSPNGKRIVFTVQQRTGRLDIYTMRADGTDRRRLTRSRANEYAPAWSPGGGRIAYTRGFPGAIWVMDRDGGNKHRLVRNAAAPSWSPRGTFVAFTRSRAVRLPTQDREHVPSVFRIRSNGAGAATRLLTPEFDRDVDASPDGTRIAFTSVRPYSASGVYVADADGSDESFLHAGMGPDWSPDGSTILLWRRGALYTVGQDGSNPTQLPEPAGHDFEFLSAWRWHPDGTRVSFASSGDVYAMDLDGSDVTRMTRADPFPQVSDFDWDPTGSSVVFSGVSCEDACDPEIFSAQVPDGVPIALAETSPFLFLFHPRVSPDGASVAFVRVSGLGQNSVWSMNADGSAERRLTAAGAGEAPAWLPEP